MYDYHKYRHGWLSDIIAFIQPMRFISRSSLPSFTLPPSLSLPSSSPLRIFSPPQCPVSYVTDTVTVTEPLGVFQVQNQWPVILPLICTPSGFFRIFDIDQFHCPNTSTSFDIDSVAFSPYHSLRSTCTCVISTSPVKRKWMSCWTGWLLQRWDHWHQSVSTPIMFPGSTCCVCKYWTLVCWWAMSYQIDSWPFVGL